MPEIKLKHVVSCSSEDSTHKADNLLSSDTYRKWKCARPGEKQLSVILQFEKEEQVHSIDIGNEGSAFIEVLVGHSTSIKDQDFEVLLVTSSFMSPSESRGNSNLNRVRFFGPQQLVKSSSQEKWDRVKIVCTQPYSKNIAYGLAFIKFHSPPDNDAPAATPPKLTKLGQFRVKDESPSPRSSLQPGSLFLKRESTDGAGVRGSPKNTTLSYAAAALHTEPSTVSPAPTYSPQAAVPVKRKFEFSKERQDAPPPSAKRHTPPPKHNTQDSENTHTSTSTKTVSISQKSPGQKSSVKPRPRPSEPIPFNRIMEGVVFVLSGFQNPFRGELRDKALAMGARYRPDWTSDATHLICAFTNTPKYSQVKAAGGLIVRKEWVMDCHKRKQKISYKRYLVDGAESSTEEEDSGAEERTHHEERKKKSPKKRDGAAVNSVKEERSDGSVDERDEEHGGDDGDDGSGMDTEDELRRVEKRKEKAGQEVEDDPYGGSTDENTDAEEEEDKPIPELPDFLTGKRFYLYGKFPENQRRLLLRYIVAFNGAVEDYMNEKVQFVITSQGWDDSFEDALMENEKLSFVKPTWIFAINDRQRMLPYQPYTVVP
ncbi:DNA repair protein XRCC1 isoform 1-T4 [Clarias gariepinus]|uniref:DNA repair protein XRCC1 isoform X1 n=1 Tax=Clarias gariepinus TaxID=13013 RepID=UPI00234E20C2|nr:DNA repair protein XRCC1 isoform X1 [Clarias gariepinus]XP_053346583.1 DNA repair protein XRCC1 isoform X1 [Clarias gariepinus]XP_053346584.1 DNA repair protein XRCC1 isoform X1 [Clarias gariepinus]XP_053346585.1 DNA repair protein XRCC1 isoform X1 [Clarias gariepinus]